MSRFPLRLGSSSLVTCGSISLLAGAPARWACFDAWGRHARMLRAFLATSRALWSARWSDHIPWARLFGEADAPQMARICSTPLSVNTSLIFCMTAAFSSRPGYFSRSLRSSSVNTYFDLLHNCAIPARGRGIFLGACEALGTRPTGPPNDPARGRRQASFDSGSERSQIRS